MTMLRRWNYDEQAYEPLIEAAIVTSIICMAFVGYIIFVMSYRDIVFS